MGQTKQKKTRVVNTILMSAFIIAIISCGDGKKYEDSKAIAEEHNEAKFENKNTEKDAQFLVNAAEISLEEIQLGILAQKNCLTNDVRQVGKMMENDHTKSLVELQQLATQKSISIPTVQSDKAFDVYKELSNKTGNKFDNEYCAIMLKGHKKAIVLFEKAVSDTADDDIRNWATKMLTVLRLHLDYIINCQKNISK